ncbi:MAG: hypothetical protein U1E83_01130 [Methylotetracoccus sp.]
MSQKRIGQLMGREAQTVALWEKSEALNSDVDFLIRHIYRSTVLKERRSYIELVDALNDLDDAEHEQKALLLGPDADVNAWKPIAA